MVDVKYIDNGDYSHGHAGSTNKLHGSFRYGNKNVQGSRQIIRFYSWS